MTLDLISNILAAFFLAAGLFFMFVGALGVQRFPDAYNRMHATSKCSTLGLLGLVLGVMFHIGTLSIVTKGVLTILFAFVANPTGTHILAKATHMDGLKQWPKTLSDELAEDYPERKQREEAEDDDDRDLFGPMIRAAKGTQPEKMNTDKKIEEPIGVAAAATRVA